MKRLHSWAPSKQQNFFELLLLLRRPQKGGGGCCCIGGCVCCCRGSGSASPNAELMRALSAPHKLQCGL